MSNDSEFLNASGRVRHQLAFRCSVCHEVKPKQKEGGTGYAVNQRKGKVCYECCALIDAKFLGSCEVGAYVKGITLYITGTDRQPHVSNWPSTLKTVVIDSMLSIPSRSPHAVTRGMFVTFTVYTGSTTDGTYRTHGTFTASLMTSSGNYLSRLRRIK